MHGIISIIEAYLEARKLETFEIIYFRSKFFNLGCSKEKVDDLLLKMDDEWTVQLLTDLNKKKLTNHLRVSYVIVIMGLSLTVISTLDFVLFNGKVMYLFYGAIIGGLTGIIISKRSLQGLKHQQKIRKVIWESWIENDNNLNSKLTKNSLSTKKTINEMFS